MAERALRDRPNEVPCDLDILGERTLVRERGAVHEACDVVANLHIRDVLPNLHDGPGVVAAQDASRGADGEVDICVAEVSLWHLGGTSLPQRTLPVGWVLSDGDGLDEDVVISYWRDRVVLDRDTVPLKVIPVQCHSLNVAAGIA